MTWQITVSGHQGEKEYGSDAHKENEASLAQRAREFVRSLQPEDNTTQARFAGNFVNEDLLAEK